MQLPHNSERREMKGRVRCAPGSSAYSTGHRASSQKAFFVAPDVAKAVICSKQRVVLRCRLDLEHVEGRPRTMPASMARTGRPRR